MLNEVLTRVIYFTFKSVQHYDVILIQISLSPPRRYAGLPFWRETRYIVSLYIIINKNSATLRAHRCMGGPLEPPKNMCSQRLHKIPFFLK